MYVQSSTLLLTDLLESFRNMYLKIYDDDDLPLLPERMKIEKVEKLVANLHDKTEYFRHIKKIKIGIKLWINFKKTSWSD